MNPPNQHNGNDYDPEIPSSFRGPYNYNDLELSIICEGWSLSDPPDTDSDSATNDPRDVDEDLWCHKCFTGFRTPGALLEHRRTSSLHITCGSCETAEDFANLMELRQHCCDRHWGCPYCEGATVWNSAAGLKRHCQIDHFPCSVCISVQYFKTRDDLQAHCRACHITCNLCPNLLVFRSQEELREHCLRQHWGCTFCIAVSGSVDEEALKTHIRLEHWSCDFCDYTQVFASRDDLLAHRRTMHGFLDVRHSIHPSLPLLPSTPQMLPIIQIYIPNIVHHSKFYPKHYPSFKSLSPRLTMLTPKSASVPTAIRNSHRSFGRARTGSTWNNAIIRTSATSEISTRMDPPCSATAICVGRP